jgi:hypothetical protein
VPVCDRDASGAAMGPLSKSIFLRQHAIVKKARQCALRCKAPAAVHAFEWSGSIF